LSQWANTDIIVADNHDEESMKQMHDLESESRIGTGTDNDGMDQDIASIDCYRDRRARSQTTVAFIAALE